MTLSGPDHRAALWRWHSPLWQLFLLGCALSACARSDAPALLDLSGVELAGESAEGEFVLRGVGFPLGRTAQVELSGVVHRPGRTSLPLRISLPAQVVGETEMRFGFARGGRAEELSPGRFEGSLTASFGAPRARVQGTLAEVSLRLRAASPRGRRDALVAARQSVSWFASLGASDLEVDAEAGGVRIGAVASGSVAERLGLRAGDRIVSLRGRPVAEVMDLLPEAGRAAVPVRLERADGGAPYHVALPRSAAQAPVRAPMKLVGGALLIGLALLLAWPLPRPPRDAEPFAIRPGPVGLTGGVVVAGLVAQWGLELHVVRGLSVTLALLLAALLVPRGAFRRPGAWLGVASRASLAALGIATAAMLAGSVRPSLGGSGIHAIAGWPLLGEPAAWASVLLTFEALRPATPNVRASALWCGARGVALASLVGMLSAGGSLGMYLDCPATLGWLLKSACVWGSLELVLRHRLSGWGLAALAVSAPAMALGWSLWNPHPGASATLAALSPWLFAGLVVRVAVTRMRARLWPSEVIDPQLVPFL